MEGILRSPLKSSNRNRLYFRTTLWLTSPKEYHRNFAILQNIVFPTPLTLPKNNFRNSFTFVFEYNRKDGWEGKSTPTWNVVSVSYHLKPIMPDICCDIQLKMGSFRVGVGLKYCIVLLKSCLVKLVLVQVANYRILLD